MTQYAPVVELSELDGHNGFRIDGNAAGDREGWAVASAGDVNGDGYDDLIVGAPYAEPQGDPSGASYVVFGNESGFGATLDLSSLDGANGFEIEHARNGARIGMSVAGVGDINGDGFADLAVGAPFSGSGGDVYIILGKAAGFPAALDLHSLDSTSGFRIENSALPGQLGASVSSAGDINGDGVDDLIIGEPGATAHGTGSGASYVVFGSTSGLGNLDLASLDGSSGFRLDGARLDHSGGSVSGAGDLNGDGFDDLIIGAALHGASNAQYGASYVVFGKASGFDATIRLSSLGGTDGFQIRGEVAGDRSGISVASAGDVNADGYADLIIGASAADPNGDMSGASYVVFGKASGFDAVVDLSALDGTNGFQINGAAAEDLSGLSVSLAGDFNGDGFDDLVVGAPGAGGTGAAYVVFGKASGFADLLDLSSLDGNDGFRIDGIATDDSTGGSVASAGDVNHDGFDDLVVGAAFADSNGDNSGSGYVILGGKPGEAVVRVGTATDNTIHGGDLDDVLSGLGGDDSLIGHGGDDVIDGSDGKDELRGGAGDDTLSGGSGADKLRGSTGHDILRGGDGDDTLSGGADADELRGGAGADRFTFAAANDSTSTHYDTIKGADFAADKWDVASVVRDIDAAVAGGALSKASFDGDMALAAAHLQGRHAFVFTPDAGQLAGSTFLVVDQNGIGGYQAGDDLVIRLDGALNLASLDASDFI